MTQQKCASRVAAAGVLLASLFITGQSKADEGGVSFWLPGQYGSLAAVPGVPGWSFASVYYHTTLDAGASKNFKIGGGVQAGLNARADLVFLNGTYIFAEPFAGAQASLGLTGAFGRMHADVNATLTGPNGNTVSGARGDSTTGIADLYPTATLKWNNGVHNYMVYTMWDVPVGSYEAGRLANIGIGHWAGDAGAGYTYFNPSTGLEFSAVAGLTYNFKNPSTDYQNGIDAHLDWGASKFISKQVHIGVVGYVYNQITGDSGSGATLGDYKSRVAAVGPQIGYMFPISAESKGYLNLKAYKEFAAENRPEGWNVWLTFAISPEMPPAGRMPRSR